MPNTQFATAATFVESVYHRANEMAGREFTSPDDDWAPMLFFVEADGRIGLAAVPMVDDKDTFAAMVAGVLLTRRAVSAVLLTSSWSVVMPEGTTDVAEVRASEHPDRREVLAITGVDQDSIFGGTAAILRSADKPPTLGPLEVTDCLLTGRLVDALRCGVSGRLSTAPA